MLEDRASLSITEIKRLNIGNRDCTNMGGYSRLKVKKTEAGSQKFSGEEAGRI